VAVNYMRATNFMMLGGLMLATCVEHSGLHRRIALRIVLMMGTSPKVRFLETLFRPKRFQANYHLSKADKILSKI
jgi:hypothetical protein